MIHAPDQIRWVYYYYYYYYTAIFSGFQMAVLKHETVKLNTGCQICSSEYASQHDKTSRTTG
jgi:hypothetical protein